MELSDAQAAETIMRFALFKEVPKRQRRKRRKLNSGNANKGQGDDGSQESGDETEDEDEDGDLNPIPERMSMPPGQKPVAAPAKQGTQDPIWGDESQDVQMEIEPSASTKQPEVPRNIDPERYVLLMIVCHSTETYFVPLSRRLKLFRTRFAAVNAAKEEEQYFVADLIQYINEGLPNDQLFGTTEATEAALAMQDEEDIMVSDGIIYM